MPKVVLFQSLHLKNIVISIIIVERWGDEVLVSPLSMPRIIVKLHLYSIMDYCRIECLNWKEKLLSEWLYITSLSFGN